LERVALPIGNSALFQRAGKIQRQKPLSLRLVTAPLVVVVVAVSGGLARVQESRRSGWMLRERPFKPPLKSQVFFQVPALLPPPCRSSALFGLPVYNPTHVIQRCLRCISYGYGPQPPYTYLCGPSLLCSARTSKPPATSCRFITCPCGSMICYNDRRVGIVSTILRVQVGHSKHNRQEGVWERCNDFARASRGKSNTAGRRVG
jgi:hypothetical protein